MIKAGFLCAVLTVSLVPQAAAQSRWANKLFVNGSVGVQATSHTLATVTPFDLYDETATINASQDIKSAPFFDISAGYRSWDNLALAIGYSRASSSSDAAITGSIPDPVFFDSFRNITASATGLHHTENVVHLMGVWMMPMGPKTDLGISAGPSIFMVSQELPGDLTLSEPAPTVTAVGIRKVKKTTAGLNLGLDYTYKLNERYGVGALARYTWGSAKIAGASDNLSVGGFQIGGGVRVRF